MIVAFHIYRCAASAYHYQSLTACSNNCHFRKLVIITKVFLSFLLHIMKVYQYASRNSSIERGEHDIVFSESLQPASLGGASPMTLLAVPEWCIHAVVMRHIHK